MREITALNLSHYRAPRWLRGGHAQTIWAATQSRVAPGLARHWQPLWQRERWTTPDDDFVDVDFLGKAALHAGPLLVLFHGLEGSARSHYARAFAHWATAHQVQLALPHFRGCSGSINRAPRSYHSGDYHEIDWLLRRLRERHRNAVGSTGSVNPMIAAGVSLGGNALMRWAGELGPAAAQWLDAAAAISSPLDLAAGGQALGRGMNRQVYTRMFLQTLKPKALAKLAQHPGLFDREALLAARDLYAFDQAYTAPVHGFASTEDYWARASAKPHLQRIAIPALLLNARNDPFVPGHSLPQAADVSAQVQLWQPEDGGHVGFPLGHWPGHVAAMPQAVGHWLLTHAASLDALSRASSALNLKDRSAAHG